MYLDTLVYFTEIFLVVTTKKFMVKYTSMFNWIYQYFGTFNQNNFLVGAMEVE